MDDVPNGENREIKKYDGRGKWKGDPYSKRPDAKRGNLATAMAAWFLRNPNEPYPVMTRIGGKLHVLKYLWEYPKYGKRGPNKKLRSDRGKKRGFKTESVDLTDYDLKEALEAIENAEEKEAYLKKYNSPASVKARKERQLAQRREFQKKKYRATVQAERAKVLPDGLKCPCCAKKCIKTQQWVICEFADVKGAICKSCYTNLRMFAFNNDVPLLRAFIKTVVYKDIKTKWQEQQKT